MLSHQNEREKVKPEIQADDALVKVKVEKVRREIQLGNALVKVIESTPDDQDTHWLFLLNQLKNPQTNRPVPKLRAEQNRNIIWDAKEKKWIKRNITQKRGRKKNTPYVKKTPMTLPPQNGKMVYFGKEANYVGIGFLIEEDGEKLVKVKDKYIFETNIVSRNKPWIFDEAKNNHTLASPRLKSITLEELRDHNDNAQAKDQILEWNEILASPSLPAVNFLFTPHDTMLCRINLLAKRALVAKELGKTLPLIIMGKDTPVKEYTLGQQLQDVKDLFSKQIKDQHFYQKKINLLQLISDYNEEKRCMDSKGKLYPVAINLDDAIAELIAVLIANKETQKVIEILNAIDSPLTSTKLDECLFQAVRNNHLQLATLLLAKGADINYIPAAGSYKAIATLSLAVDFKHQEIFSAMMKLAPERFKPESLQQALIFASNLHPEATSEFYVSKLLNTNVEFDPNTRYWTNTGYQALHTAAEKQYLSVIKVICQHGGNPGSVASKNLTPGQTPLNIAFSHKNFKAIQIMLQYGGERLTVTQRTECLLKLLRCEQYALAKSILNSSAEIDIKGYGADFASIIENIARDKNMSEHAKQILALHFINKFLNAATTQEGVMQLEKLLETCSSTAKAFMFQPANSGTNMFQRWNNESVCSFWSSVMKLTKNRLLDILNQSDQVAASTETKDFLGARRTNFGFVSTTTSMKILNEQDRKKQAQLILEDRNKVTSSLSKQYGLRR